jgi:hypothetical protein
MMFYFRKLIVLNEVSGSVNFKMRPEKQTKTVV